MLAFICSERSITAASRSGAFSTYCYLHYELSFVEASYKRRNLNFELWIWVGQHGSNAQRDRVFVLFLLFPRRPKVGDSGPCAAWKDWKSATDGPVPAGMS